LAKKSKDKAKRKKSRPNSSLADVQSVTAMVRTPGGEEAPLDIIAPLSDVTAVLAAATPRIVAAAKASAIARHNWKDRGVACIGYTAGMAVAYASAFARLQAHDPVADRMSRALEPAFRDSHGRLKGDALTWYSDQFRAVGMGTATAVERLRGLFVLLLGLGMRESSGRFCEGRDRSANNISADTAEAGLFQMSFDLVAPRAELLDVFHHYQSNPAEGLIEIFKWRYRRDRGRRTVRIAALPPHPALPSRRSARNVRQ